MNISPIDMQVLLPRSSEVGKAQNVRDHQNVVQQDFGAAQYQQKAHVKLTQVQTTEKSEGRKIKRDEEKNNKQQQDSQKKQDTEDSEENQEEVKYAVDNFRGHHIDVKM